MYKSIDTPAVNSAVVCGTLLGMNLREGKSSAEKGAKPYRSVSATIRVAQSYGGKPEVSEVPVNLIAMKFNNDGTESSTYESLGRINQEFKTAQTDGMNEATHVLLNGRRSNGRLVENLFPSRSTGEIVSTWGISGQYLTNTMDGSPMSEGCDCAVFDVEVFILNIERELNNYGEETGRLKIRAGIVGYHRSFSCFNFFVEDASAIDYIERNYSVNDTARFTGRIRSTSETSTYIAQNTWGEPVPQTSTKKLTELIITGPGAGGENGPYEEERAYNPEDIRVLVADRNTMKEQKKMAQKVAVVKKAEKASAIKTATYGWEE